MMFRVRISAAVLLIPAMSMLLSTETFGEDWPHFRGPNSAGIATESRPLPAEFSAEKNVRWSKKLGDGIGCPVVASSIERMSRLAPVKNSRPLCSSGDGTYGVPFRDSTRTESVPVISPREPRGMDTANAPR